MADIDINYDLLDGNLKYAIVCNNKFEVEHCLKALKKSFPSAFFTTIKRFSRYILDFGFPAAISPNLHNPVQMIGYDRPDYYKRNGYMVVNFQDVIDEKEFPESDVSLEEFFGIKLVSA